MHEIGIENESIDSSPCYCKFANKEKDDQSKSGNCKRRQQGKVVVGTPETSGCSQYKAKPGPTLATHQSRSVVAALQVGVFHCEVNWRRSAVVEGAVWVKDQPSRGIVIAQPEVTCAVDFLIINSTNLCVL